MLRFDAAHLMKTALTGTSTEKFTNIIQGAFGGIDPASMHGEFDLPDEPEEEEEELLAQIEDPPTAETSIPSTSTLSKAMKRKTSDPSDISLPPKATRSSSKGICSLADATIVYPLSLDKKKYLHTGVEERFISEHQSTTGGKATGYGCEFTNEMKKEGKIFKSCDFISTVRGQLSTYIRQHHLGVAIACFVCDKRWWSAHTWIQHMRNVNSALSENDFYVKEGADIAELQQGLFIKQEVSSLDIE